MSRGGRDKVAQARQLQRHLLSLVRKGGMRLGPCEAVGRDLRRWPSACSLSILSVSCLPIRVPFYKDSSPIGLGPREAQGLRDSDRPPVGVSLHTWNCDSCAASAPTGRPRAGTVRRPALPLTQQTDPHLLVPFPASGSRAAAGSIQM